MKKEFIFVTGFFGAPLMEKAQHIAEEKGYTLISLDEEIEKSDGRSIRRICMVMGEHEYRNQEYAAISKIIEMNNAIDSQNVQGFVICCGDGVLLDDMTRQLIQQHTLVVLGADLPLNQLWHNAKKEKNTYHAFMNFGTEQERQAAFKELYERQRMLYTPYIT